MNMTYPTMASLKNGLIVRYQKRPHGICAQVWVGRWMTISRVNSLSEITPDMVQRYLAAGK